MPPDSDSPKDWLRYIRSDLELAEGPSGPHVLPEMLCFHAQQAVEKCLKAVLLHLGLPYPKTHNLTVLYGLLPSDLNPPPEVEEAVGLSDYAVTSRYPGEFEPVSLEDYHEALRLARAVVAWAEGVVGGGK
jgi:HEPN domain-containing protein